MLCSGAGAFTHTESKGRVVDERRKVVVLLRETNPYYLNHKLLFGTKRVVTTCVRDAWLAYVNDLRCARLADIFLVTSSVVRSSIGTVTCC